MYRSVDIIYVFIWKYYVNTCISLSCIVAFCSTFLASLFIYLTLLLSTVLAVIYSYYMCIPETLCKLSYICVGIIMCIIEML